MQRLVGNIVQRTRPSFNTCETKFQAQEKQALTEKLQQEFAYLYKLPMFRIFSEEEFFCLLAKASLIKTHRCTDLVKAGDTNSSCYFIVSGCPELTISHQDKKSKVAMHGPNTLVCPISSLQAQTEIFHFRTAAQAVLLEFSIEQLDILKKERVQLWYKYYDLIFMYIISLEKKLNTQMIRLSTEHFESLILV